MLDSRVVVNKQTAIIVSKVKERQVTNKQTCLITSLVPIPVTTWYGRRQDNLTGLKVGRLTVVGPSFRKSNINDGNGSSWVVRCSCGRYQTYKNRTLKRKAVDR